MASKGSLKILYSVIGGVFVGVVSVVFLTFATPVLCMFVLGVLALVIPLGLALKRFLQKNLADPLGLFALFFSAYNGLLILNFAIQPSYMEEFYPLQFEPQYFAQAAVMSCIAAFGLWLGAFLYEKTIPSMSQNAISWPPGNAYFTVGVVTFVGGLALYFLNYKRIGGFIHALSMVRGVRMDLMSSMRGNLPFLPLILVGTTLMALGTNYEPGRVKKLILTVCVGIWGLLMVITGDRRYLVYVLLICLGSFSLVKQIVWRPRAKTVIGAIALYLMFVAFAQLRWMIPVLWNGSMRVNEAVRWIAENASIEWIIPARSEFAGPYFSLVYACAMEEGGMLHGQSYWQAIPMLLPRSLYPGEKPLFLGQAFAKAVSPANAFRVVGWGYSPVAEAYVNFGAIGVFGLFAVFGAIFAWLARVAGRSAAMVSAYCVILPQTLNLNRIDFASAFQELVYGLVILIMALTAVRVLTAISAFRHDGSS